MARGQGARSQFLFAFESTYGTAPGSGYTRLPVATSGLGKEQTLLESELLGMGRDPAAPMQDAIKVDGDISVPIDEDAIGFWLKAAFGAPATTGSSNYTHVFESGGWTLPSFTYEYGQPEVPFFGRNIGCRLDKIGFSLQHSGLLTASIGVIGQDETKHASSIEASPADITLARYGNIHGSLDIDGSTAANIVSAEINYVNNLDRIETVAGSGKIAGVDPSMAACTGTIVARFADTTLYDEAIAGTPVRLTIGTAKSATRLLTFDMTAVYLAVPKLTVEGPQGIQATFNWIASKPASDPMVEVTLKNGKASY